MNGGIILRVKHYASEVRPLLHALSLFAPTLLMACLIGRRRALSLVIFLPFAIESAQTAFGYGFGKDDVFDLFYDGIGIAAAILVCGRLEKWLPHRFASRITPETDKLTSSPVAPAIHH